MNSFIIPDATSVLKVFGLAAIAFVVAMATTPILTHFLYAHQLWRKEVRTTAPDGAPTPIFQKLHGERETKTPRMGGVLIWTVTALLAFGLFFLSKIIPHPVLEKLNFLSRNQTWLPLALLLAGSFLGLADDMVQIRGKGGYVAGGVRLSRRIGIVALLGLLAGWWFYTKLGVNVIHIPMMGDFSIGVWYVPFFVIVMLATFSGGVVDGLDGLAGGVFATIFGAFSAIALFQNQIDLAAFAAVIAGTTLAFLWFNIPPARFFMGETGIIGLVSALVAIAFLTDSVLILPIIAFILVIESLSVILQLLSKKFRHKKLFLVAPIHHHFEAKGWPHYKVTMRFWVVSAVMAIIGVTARLLG